MAEHCDQCREVPDCEDTIARPIFFLLTLPIWLFVYIPLVYFYTWVWGMPIDRETSLHECWRYLAVGTKNRRLRSPDPR